MAFKLVRDPDNTQFRTVRIASQAYTIGDLVQFDRTADAIDVTPATASTTTYGAYGVAMQTVTSSATALLICETTVRQDWVVDTTNTPATNDNMQRMVLTDKATVNNTHTDDSTSAAVVTQLGVVDATNKKALVRFNASPNVTA